MCTRPLPPARRWPSWLALIALISGVASTALWVRSATAAQERRPERATAQTQRADLKAFMERKLTHTQEALRGLVRRDYATLGEAARSISLLCLDEQWNRVVTPETLQRTTEFRRTANQLARAADEKNLDRAAMQYLLLTSQCFECHRGLPDPVPSPAEKGEDRRKDDRR